ncbi:hypothetical protein [Roseibium sp.]|uniref:hypothetical protein n=1 Tax=Roseibium sp. TaxID=1936156 RepID=UPI003B5061D8
MSVFSGVETVSLDRRRDFLFDFSASVLQARRLSTGLASLPATDTEAPDDAVLDVWRKELGATSAHTGKKGDLSFLLLKNILYWGSVAMSLYLIFTVFSFF